MLTKRSVSVWINQLFSYMGGCLGCCANPTPIIAVDELSKGLKYQGRTVKRPTRLEDFWSTSTCEMDYSAVQSRRSISSVSTSNQTFDSHSGAGSTSYPPEFVNTGLLLWNQTREQWLVNKRPESRRHQTREPRISFLARTYCICIPKQRRLCSWNATYDSLLGTNKPFKQPVPLSEMIDFLVDIWEQEGMYD